MVVAAMNVPDRIVRAFAVWLAYPLEPQKQVNEAQVREWAATMLAELRMLIGDAAGLWYETLERADQHYIVEYASSLRRIGKD